MKSIFVTGLVLSLSILAAGCGRQESTDHLAESGSPAVAAVDGAQFLLNEEPEGGQDVIAVRESAENEDEVVIVGRIGGRKNPWIDGRAAFSIVDPSLKACSDIPGDMCPHPWDYCCEMDKLPTSTALVKFVDDEGRVIKSDARQLLDVTELQTVVVRGTAQRDESGNLTVLAKDVFVKDAK